MSDRIKVAVVDDQQLFRQGMISLIREFREFQVVIEASNGVEFLEALKKRTPDVVLLDVEMPEMDGAEVTEYLNKHFPDMRVIILTMHDDDELVYHLAQKGAYGFLLKDSDIDTVAEAVNTVMEGRKYFKEHINEMLLQGMSKRTRPQVLSGLGDVVLSDREKEILRMICKEHTTREISEHLNISTKTVESHRERIYQKINVRNMAGLVKYAMRHNLLE